MSWLISRHPDAPKRFPIRRLFGGWIVVSAMIRRDVANPGVRVRIGRLRLEASWWRRPTRTD